MGVSENGGTPKSSNLIGISILNHPFWGTPVFGNTHMAIWIKKVMGKHHHLFLSFSKTARNFPKIFQADTLEFHAYAEVEMPWSGKGCHPGRF